MGALEPPAAFILTVNIPGDLQKLIISQIGSEGLDDSSQGWILLASSPLSTSNCCCRIFQQLLNSLSCPVSNIINKLQFWQATWVAYPALRFLVCPNILLVPSPYCEFDQAITEGNKPEKDQFLASKRGISRIPATAIFDLVYQQLNYSNRSIKGELLPAQERGYGIPGL